MTTTDMHSAFLADIIAHPDDLAPRLIYADWLDEQGDIETARRIREQITDGVEVWGRWFMERNASLSYYPLKQWLGPLIEPSVVVPRDESQTMWRFELSVNAPESWFHWRGMNPARWRFGWRNGFVEEIHAPLWAWLELAEVWTTQTPLRTYRPYFECRPAYINAAGWRVAEAPCEVSMFRDFWGNEHVGKLDTLDLTGMPGDGLAFADYIAFRPWRGLRRLLLRSLPYLSDMSQTRRLEQWQRILPDVTIEFVEG